MDWLWFVAAAIVVVAFYTWLARRQRRHAGSGTVAEAKRGAHKRAPESRGGFFG